MQPKLLEVERTETAVHTRHEFDNYPTEARVTAALISRIAISGTVCEPCANVGTMADVLAGVPAVTSVWANDIDIAYAEIVDFLSDASQPDAMVWDYPIAKDGARPFDWVVTNPPFNQAMAILRQSWEQAAVGVAFLLRLSFLEPVGERSDNRGEWLAAHEDQMVAIIPLGQPRPSFTGDGKTDTATTAWFVWRKDWSWDALGIERPFKFVMNWK